MKQELYDYIKLARSESVADSEIGDLLVAAGWPEAEARSALLAKPFLPAAPSPHTSAPMGSLPSPMKPGQPIAVVSNWTTRGLEYVIMFIALGVAATSLGWILHNFVDSALGQSGTVYEAGVSFASAALLVTLPVFLVLFLRLKKAELKDSTIRQDASRRRMTQLTLLITFLVGLGHIVSYIYSLLNSADAEVRPAGNLIHMIITVAIAGGIFFYYWRDEHRHEEQ